MYQVTTEALISIQVNAHIKSQFGKYYIMKQRFTVKIDQYTGISEISFHIIVAVIYIISIKTQAERVFRKLIFLIKRITF